MRKRLLAFLLSLCMIFSLLPVTAFAVEDPFNSWQFHIMDDEGFPQMKSLVAEANNIDPENNNIKIHGVYVHGKNNVNGTDARATGGIVESAIWNARGDFGSSANGKADQYSGWTVSNTADVISEDSVTSISIYAKDGDRQLDPVRVYLAENSLSHFYDGTAFTEISLKGASLVPFDDSQEGDIGNAIYHYIVVEMDGGTKADFDALPGELSQQIRIYSTKYPVVGYRAFGPKADGSWTTPNAIGVTANSITQIALTRDNAATPSNIIPISPTNDPTYDVTFSEATHNGLSALRIYISKKVPVQTYSVTYQWDGVAPASATKPATVRYQAGAEVTVDPQYRQGHVETTDGYKYTFSGWTVPDGITVSDGKFMMPAEDVTITGSWEVEAVTPTPSLYTINVTVVNGSATCGDFSTNDSGTGNFTAAVNTNYMITFTPKEGYVFDSATVDGKPVTLTNNTYTLNYPTNEQSHSIVVAYKSGSTVPEPKHDLIYVTFTNDKGTPIEEYANLKLQPNGTVTAPTMDGDKEIESWRYNNLTPYSGPFTFEAVEDLIDEGSWSDEGWVYAYFYAVYGEEEPEPEQATLKVVFVDEETGLEVEGGTDSVTVPTDKQTVALSELTPPTGYVLSENNADPTTAKNDQFTIFVKQNRTFAVSYQINNTEGYFDGLEGVESYTVTMTEQNYTDYSILKPIPEDGYQFVHWNYNGDTDGTLPTDATLSDVIEHVFWYNDEGNITLTAVFERITRDVTVRFFDEVANREVGSRYTMAVDPDAYNVNTSKINPEWIPEDYELARTGDLLIENGVVTVPVRRIAPTDAELKALLWNLQVDCTTEGHEPITTGLLDGSYTVTGDGLGVQGDYYYIQLNTAPYVAAYDAYSETHTCVDGSTMTIVLYHDDIKWIVPDTLMVRLNCERAVYNTIHVSFVNYVDGKDVSLGGGDVISTAPSVKLETPAPSGFTPEGKTFVGWKVRLGNSPMYEGEFTYDALYALMQEHGQDFYENQAWLTFEPVFADDYRVIHLKFVDEDENVIGSGDVISTYPDQEYDLPDPAPFAPAGQSFVGWKVWVNGEPMYDGKFTFSALSQLLDSGFYGEEAWLTFQAVYADDYRVIHLKFVDEDENVIGAGDVISTYPDQEYVLPDPAPFAPEGQSFVGWKVWVNDEPMYNGDFTFAALEQLLDSGFSGEEAWLTFQAVYADDSDADTYTLTYDANYSGGRDKSYDYEVGDDGRVRVTVEENMFRRSGYTFTGWNTRANGNGTNYEEGDRLTLTGDLTLYAQWRKNGSTGTDTTSYTIDASASRGGDISPEGRVFVARGNDRTFRITADEGYVIDDVRVDGESVGAVRTYTFENVRRDHTIEVIFVPDGQQTVAYGPDDTGVSDWLNVDDHVSYLNGYPGGLFGPNDNMTRAEVAQMFYNLLLNQNVTVTVSFADVSADAWYAQAVNALASLGIVQGVGDGMFAPERTITRAEFTVIAMRFAELPTGGTNPFSDVRTSDWFYAQVVGAAQYGWITGYTNGTFGPNNTITRAEVTAIVNRMLSRSADEDFVDDNAAELVRFNDVSDTYWAYYDIMEATNSHEYEWDNNAEEWTDLA